MAHDQAVKLSAFISLDLWQYPSYFPLMLRGISCVKKYHELHIKGASLAVTSSEKAQIYSLLRNISDLAAMAAIPSLPLRRISASNQSFSCGSQQVRHATFLRRPYRPYTFTQLITLSDGSTYTQRTTSPAPVHKSTRDSRNNPMWQPSMISLRNVEEDEAGRLKAFRDKFGRGWDADTTGSDNTADGLAGQDGAESEEDSLMDLISGYSSSDDPAMRWEKSTSGIPKPKGGK